LLVFLIYFIELNKDFYLDKETHITNSHDRLIYNDNKYWITFNWPFKIRLFPVSNTDFKLINKFETIIYYIIVLLLIGLAITWFGNYLCSQGFEVVTWLFVILPLMQLLDNVRKLWK
jgi:hypothetical protein